MKITKKQTLGLGIILLFFSIQILGILSLAPAAKASLWDQQTGMSDADGIGEAFGVSAGDAPTDFRVTIGKFIRIFLGFLGVIFMVLMLVGGFKWMTSQGNENVIDGAKGMIKAAVIGLVIVTMSFAISQAIMNYIYETTI